MQRRGFSAAALALATAAVCGAWPHAALAQQSFSEGREYLALDKPLPVEAPAGKVEVVEFFWYYCPHCYNFEPQLQAWLKNKPANVVFRRVPVAFNSGMEVHQRTYYALEALGKVEALQQPLFDAIHKEKQNLTTADAMANWVDKHGVPKAKFLEQFNSFATATKVRKATQLQNEFRVDGVPAMGVAGRYYTDGALAGSMERVLQTVNFLITKK